MWCGRAKILVHVLFLYFLSSSDTSSCSEGEGQGDGDEEEGGDGEEEDGGGGGGNSSSQEGSITMEHWISRAIHGPSSTTTTSSSTASSSSSSTRSGGSGAGGSRLADVLAQHIHITSHHQLRHHHHHRHHRKTGKRSLFSCVDAPEFWLLSGHGFFTILGFWHFYEFCSFVETSASNLSEKLFLTTLIALLNTGSKRRASKRPHCLTLYRRC